MQNTEAVISIFLSTLSDRTDDKAVYEAMMAIEQDGKPYTGPVYGNKIKFEESDEFAILVSDRELTADEAWAFYNELMEYHQGIGHDLSEEEMVVRDEEVKNKWLNGNFNWWALGAGKLEEKCICSCCGCGCKE